MYYVAGRENPEGCCIHALPTQSRMIGGEGLCLSGHQPLVGVFSAVGWKCAAIARLSSPAIAIAPLGGYYIYLKDNTFGILPRLARELDGLGGL